MGFELVKGFNRGGLVKVLILETDVTTLNNGYKFDKFRFRKEMGTKWFTKG